LNFEGENQREEYRILMEI